MPTISDFFCGAGGSSAGAVQVPGLTTNAARDILTQVTAALT